MTFPRFMAAVAVVIGGFFFLMWLGTPPEPRMRTGAERGELRPFGHDNLDAPTPSPFERDAETTFTREAKP